MPKLAVVGCSSKPRVHKHEYAVVIIGWYMHVSIGKYMNRCMYPMADGLPLAHVPTAASVQLHAYMYRRKTYWSSVFLWRVACDVEDLER